MIFGVVVIVDGQNLPHKYTVGGRSVMIPPPEGFTEVLAKYNRFAHRFSDTESPDLEILALHVQDSLIPRIEKREDPDLDLFTKVSVSRSAKEIEMTAETFAAVVANLEENFDKYLDPDGPVVKAMIKNTDKGLDRYWRQETGTSISQPRSLGFFDKQANVFSAMMISNIEVLEQKRTMLSTVSLLNLNKRLVFDYVYKVLHSETDTVALRDFTKKWTAVIIAVNQ